MSTSYPLNSLCNAVDLLPTEEALEEGKFQRNEISDVVNSKNFINNGVRDRRKPLKRALVELYEGRCARVETCPCAEHIRILEGIPSDFIVEISECVHRPRVGGALVQHVSVLCSGEQLGAFLTTISPPCDSEVILMIDTLDLTGTPVLCEHLEEMLENACHWGNWWRLRCLILQRCSLNIAHLSALCSIERITSLWNLEYLDISWNLEIGWNNSSHSIRTKLDFCSPELLLLFNLWRHAPIKRLQIEFIGLACEVLSVLLSMLNNYVKPLDTRSDCGIYHHNGIIENIEYFSLGPIESKRSDSPSERSLTGELEKLVCSAPRISYLQCFGLQDSARITQAWNQKNDERGHLYRAQEKDGSIILGNFEAGSFCKIIDHRYGTDDHSSGLYEGDQSSMQLEERLRTYSFDTIANPLASEEVVELVQDDLLLKPTIEFDPYDNNTEAKQQKNISSLGEKRCTRSNLDQRKSHLSTISSRIKLGIESQVPLGQTHCLEYEVEKSVVRQEGKQEKSGHAKAARSPNVSYAKKGLDKISRTPKKLSTNENLIVNLDSSPGPVVSEQEQYKDHVSFDMMDRNALDQPQDHGHHRLSDLSFKLRDGMLDEDSRLGLKYRALAKKLIKDIPSRQDQKHARNAFRLWDECAQNPWDRKRWDNPSKTQNDEPHLLRQLNLLFDILEKYKMCLGFPFPMRQKSDPEVFSENKSSGHGSHQTANICEQVSNSYGQQDSENIMESLMQEHATTKKPRLAMILSSDSSSQSDEGLDERMIISGKTSKNKRELRRLEAWAWDSRFEDHPPNRRVYGMKEGKRQRKKVMSLTELFEKTSSADFPTENLRVGKGSELEWSSDDDAPLFAQQKTAHFSLDEGKVQINNLKQKATVVPDSQESW